MTMRECKCGCGTAVDKRDYAWGHKPKTGGGGLPVGDRMRRTPRPAAVREVGYDPMRELVDANIAAAKARRQEIVDEIQALAEQRDQMFAQQDAVTKDLVELIALRTALAPFCTAPAAVVEAEETPA